MILWLLACAGTPTVTERASPHAQPGTAPSTDTGEPGLPAVAVEELEPSWSPEDVGERLATALGQMPDPTEAVNTYANLMRQGDAVCPGSERVIVDTWLYGCDASTGYSFAGVTDWLTGEYDVAGQPMEMEGVAGDFWIDTPEGHRLEGGGNAVVLTDGSTWIGDLTGSWRYSGGSDWFAYGFSGTVSIQHLPGLFTLAEGAADVLGTHMALHELMLPDACNGGAQGDLSLRDPNGGWYRIAFEGCTECGPITFEGTPIGEACVDFGPFLTRIGSWP